MTRLKFMKCFWLWPVWCLLPSFLLKETLFLPVRSIRCFTFRPLLFRFSSKSFCNDVNVMYSWRERSSWIYFGSDLFGVFCIPVFDESLTFPVSSCCFACCPVAFVFLSLGEASLSLFELFVLLLLSRCFFDVPQCLLQPCQIYI